MPWSAPSNGETVLNAEFEIETLDGQRKSTLNSVAPIRDETGAVTGGVISTQDISDLRRLEREVAERAQELGAIFETMTDGVFVYDAQEHITRINAAAREILGPDALAYAPMQERAARQQPLDEKGQPLPVEGLPSVRILSGEVLTGAQAVDVYFSTPEGRTQAFSASGTPLRTAEGALAGAVMVTRDVTERRQLEREVAEHAQELGAIFEAMTDGIAFLDARGQLIRTNHAFRTLHGVDQDPDFLHLPLDRRLATLALADEQGRPLAVDEWPATRLLQGEALAGVDVRVTTLQGREVVLNVGGAPIRDQEGR
jgi:PAS domain-containing protein